MKTPIAPLCWTGFVSALLCSHAAGQATYSWRAEAAGGTWQLADNWWDGVQQPRTPVHPRPRRVIVPFVL